MNYFKYLFSPFIIGFSLFAAPEIHSGEVYYLFSHGIADTKNQANIYTAAYNPLGFMEAPITTFNYPDATQRFWRVNFWQTSLGQENEISTLNNAYQQLLKTAALNGNKKPKIVIVGLSRGATAALNFIAQHQPKIHALILESPFDHAQSITSQMLRNYTIGKYQIAHTLAHYALSVVFWKYRTYGPHAINAIESIKADLPILIIASQQDQLVPHESTEHIYQKLINTGHTNVHFCSLDHGKHAKIISHDKSGPLYAAAVAEFKRRYQF